MFFFLSKILAFLLSPFFYLALILLWTFFCKNHRKQKKLLSITLIMVFFFGNRFIIDEFIRLWEPDIKNNKTEHYDIAIVLGGMANYDASNDIIRFN